MTATLDFDPDPAPAATVGHHRTLAGRLSRCMSVSVITTAISMTIIVVATSFLGIAAALANVIATSVATVPSYSLNRRWTWGRRDRSDPWREVLPFWILAFCGLVLSTVMVALTDAWIAPMHLGSTVHTGAILAGHLSGFGLLWVVQFLLLDHVLFAGGPTVSVVEHYGRDDS